MIETLSRDQLVAAIKRLVQQERENLGDLLAHLAQLEKCSWHEELGFPSLYMYCVHELRYSEEAAYLRAHTAKAIAHYPMVLDMIRAGELHMAAVALLTPHLTDRNHKDLFNKAKNKSKREVEKIVAEFRPRLERSDVIRHLPPAPAPQEAGSELPLAGAPAPAATAPETSHDAAGPNLQLSHEPTAPPRVRFAFTASEEFLRKLERARALLRHRHPTGKLEGVFEAALDTLLDKKDPERRLARKAALKRRAPPSNGSESSRRIPQEVKDSVWQRDEGRCAFKTPQGRRCPEALGLEYDHIVPWALGGSSRDAGNIRLLCRAHNQFLARRLFGNKAIRSAPNGEQTRETGVSPGG